MDAIIKLADGRSAIVDAEILDRQLTVELPSNLTWTGKICDVTWRAVVKPHTSYVVATLNGSIELRLHRLITQAKREQLVDHRDRDGLNNRHENLRITDPVGNAHNRGVNVNSKTGCKGVCFHRQSGKYAAHIRINGKKQHLGLHTTVEAAARAYDERARKEFGEFAKLNFENDRKAPQPQRSNNHK